MGLLESIPDSIIILLAVVLLFGTVLYAKPWEHDAD